MTRHSVRFGLYLVIGYLYSGSISSAQTPSREYIRVNGRVVAIESTAINTACGATQTALPFRGTGTATGTGVLTDGTIDSNWKLVSNPGNYPESSAVDLIAFTFAAYGNPIPNAKPINHSGNAAFHPVGAYVFRQKLDLSCHNPATLAISGTVQADDNLQIYVNGKLQSSPPAAWNIRVPFTIGGGAFVQGWNYVDFVVTNIGDPGNNPYMLWVDVTAATATPDLASNGLKFELTSTPAGGSRTGNSSVALSSGTQAVAWAMEAPVQGSLSGATSTTVTYAGPGTVSSLTVGTVKATSTTGNPAKTTFFPVWMNPGVGGGTISISGSTTNLAPYATRAFSATLSGLPPGQDTVRWSVVSVPASTSSNGLISTGTTCVAPPASMNYRAPSTITNSGNIVLKAESCSNTSLSATIMIPVAIASSVTVTMSPKPASIAASQQFSAAVSNADGNGVNWTLTPTNAGTLSASGLFNRAPGFSGNATVKATSAENPNVFDSHPFNIPAVVSISLTSSAPSQSIVSSATANFPITYTSTGTTGQVFFSFVNLPAGANFNINPSSVTNQGTANITASVSPGASAAGVYNFTFRATNGTLTQDLPLTLSIVDCGTITVSPSSVSVFPFQMANFTATRSGAAANYGVTWTRDTPAGSFSSQLDPPTVPNPQISYYAADPSTQPQTVIVTARTNNPNTACQAFAGTATVTKQTYVPNGLSLLYTNPLATVVPLNFSRFFDYGAASQNGAGTVRFIQLELRNNLGEIYQPATACAINFETTTNNNDPNASTSYALAKVANNAAAGGSADNTAIVPRGGSGSTQVVGTSSLWNCELDGTGSDYVRSGNIFAPHMKVRMKTTVFSPGTIHVYVRSFGMDPYEPAIRQYMGSFTATN